MVGAGCGDSCEPEAVATTLTAAGPKAALVMRAPPVTEARINNILVFFI